MLILPQNGKLYYIILIFRCLTVAVMVQNTNFPIMKPLKGLNDNDNNDIPIPFHCCKLLQAVLMLRKHVVTFNNPFACKLKVMLGSFGQQTCVVKMQHIMDTKITGYFVCK